MTSTKRPQNLRLTIARNTAAALLFFGSAIFVVQPALAADVIVYRNASCGCCGKWADHMRGAGFAVEVRNSTNLDQVKSKYGVPTELQACHTAVVAGYVIEGHVPADDIKRLLAEKPDIKGLAVPGMPMGSPGMEGPHKEPYSVLSLDKQGKTSVFSQH